MSEPAPPARCDTRQRLDVLREAARLGVPHDYGRTRALRIVREPRELVCVGEDIHARHQWLAPRAARAFVRLRDAAAHDGVELQLVSAFRSAEYQLGILKRKLERGQSVEEILRVSAAPGYSEHHSGRVVDLTTPGYAALEEEFEHSPAFAWLARRAREFGFVLSYPRGNRHAIAYEPWHWCWHARSSSRGATA
ncbi:M15 family metallopeptidase [Dokdonella sp.]|uniref:M15 family metallopeptidase n=1 Tax=Dokdonella sp. TaxID=2291710 RepID=UPI0025B9B71D|nr:M15 family metallopeptidase [Dokdonella sp.]